MTDTYSSVVLTPWLTGQQGWCATAGPQASLPSRMRMRMMKVIIIMMLKLN